MAKFTNELNNYQNVPRELVFDSSLSDRARFVYCFMACKPADWDFFLEPMAKEIGYSVDTLRKYINELVESGWLEKGEQDREKGMFGSVQYTLKATKNTDTGKNRHGEIPTQHNIDDIQNRESRIKEKEDKSSKKKEEDEFVERMYTLYPSKCPKRNTSLGKTKKDKERIKKLLKCYSMEEIELVFKHEIDEKYDKQYMQNFSTFLNNFPDPCEIITIPCSAIECNEQLVINGQIYR